MNQGNYTAKTVKYQHPTEAERKIIERQTELGTPKRQIARLLGINVQRYRNVLMTHHVLNDFDAHTLFTQSCAEYVF